MEVNLIKEEVWEDLLTKINDWRDNVKYVLENSGCTAFMTLLTFWALFGDDLRLATTEASADVVFEWTMILVFVCFALEIVLASFSDPAYLGLPTREDWQVRVGESRWQMWRRRLSFGSFYLWLDLASTISLFMELSFVQGGSENADDSADSARAGRASRAGAKAGKIVKLARMTRLVRTIKLYKYLTASREREQQQHLQKRRASITYGNDDFRFGQDQNSLEESKDAAHDENYSHQGHGLELVATVHRKKSIAHAKGNMSKYKKSPDEDAFAWNSEEETHVGATLTDLTTRRVIILVLVMLITIPFFIEDANDKAPRFWTRTIATMHSCGSPCEDALLDTLVMAVREAGALSISNHNVTAPSDYLYLDRSRLQELRSDEVMITTAGDIVAVYDILDQSKDSAVISCFLTLFVIILLSFASYVLSNDMNTLVINPIEKMVAVVKKISEDPLGRHYGTLKEEDGFSEGMETTLLMQTINKIGRLMKVGFGEAGTVVIANVLTDSNGGSLDFQKQRGRLVHSIFGFCDIRQFTDTTECLQEEVMLFVNKIASILHSIVVQCDGSANKNIGDAFLLTWKLHSKHGNSGADDYKMLGRGADHFEDTILADKALYAFVRALIELKRHNNFICNFSVTSTLALYKRFPAYKVRIGSGLHVGWAIEGALGSHRKIDVSYLSPHVNMSEFLESSTKTYGTSLLMSEPFFALLSADARACCRQVDRIASPVNIKTNGTLGGGSIRAGEAMCIYTFDMDTRAIGELHCAQSPTPPKDNDQSQQPVNNERAHRRRGSIKRLSDSFLENTAVDGGHRRSVLMTKEPTAFTKDIEMGLAPDDDDDGGDGSTNRLKALTIKLPQYSSKLWGTDIDLLAARRIYKDDGFRMAWERALEAYIRGDWVAARVAAMQTNQLIEQRGGESDGPSLHLLDVIESRGIDGRAPSDWKGYIQ